MVQRIINILFSIPVVFSLSSFPPVHAASPGGQFAAYENAHMMNPGVDWMMLILWGLVLAILILALGRLMAPPRNAPQSKKHGKSPMEILEARFASGEIDPGEFEQRKQIILE